MLIPWLHLLFWRRVFFGIGLLSDTLLLLLLMMRFLILVVLVVLLMLLLLLLLLLMLCHHLLVHFLVLMHLHGWSASLTLLSRKILCLFWGHVAVKVVRVLRVIWIGVWFLLLLVLLLGVDVVIDGGVDHHHLIILILLEGLRVWHHMSWWRPTSSHHSWVRMHPVRRNTWHAGRSHTMRRHVHSLRVHVRSIRVLLIHSRSCLLLRTLLRHILRSTLDQFGILTLTFILLFNHGACPKIRGSRL